MKYIARNLENRDIRPLEKVYASIFPEYGSAGLRFILPMVDYNLSWVLVYKLHIIGFALVGVDFKNPYLYYFGILKDYRSRGLGRFLLKAALTSPRSMSLHVRRSNRAAIKVYLDAGFEPVSIIESYYNLPREDAVLMEMKNE